MLDYLHIGASRTGSTWLYRNLVLAHPKITTPNGKKFTVFWNQKTHAKFLRKRGNKNWKSYLRDISWYQELYQDRNDGILLADITDGNSWLPKRRVREIYKYYPDVRISYAIRNPITTIWSHVVKHDKLLSVNAPLKEMKKALIGPPYVYNTQYMENIEKWLDIFNQEQVLMYFFTEIKTEPIKLLHKLCDHLKIERHSPKIELNVKINEGEKITMPNDILSLLVDYHADRIMKMSKFFSRDLSHWLEGKE